MYRSNFIFLIQIRPNNTTLLIVGHCSMSVSRYNLMLATVILNLPCAAFSSIKPFGTKLSEEKGVQLLQRSFVRQSVNGSPEAGADLRVCELTNCSGRR